MRDSENIHVNNELKPLWDKIQKNYPLRKYIIQEDEETKMAPQASLIHIALGPDEDLTQVVDSYLTFHKMHLHLKNFLVTQRKRAYGYKREFVDIFLDIFLDNFLIFKELVNYIDENQFHFMHIWFDGYFIKLFDEIVQDSTKKFHRLQPKLFFMILLYLSLPEISDKFVEIPFTSVIEFHKKTEEEWTKSIELIKKIDFRNPENNEGVEYTEKFLFNLMDISVQYDKKKFFYFDDETSHNCIRFLNVLIEKTPEMITNIKKAREYVSSNPVK